MNDKYNSLADIEVGKIVKVKKLNSTGTMRRRLQDLGVIEGTDIECVLKGPFGDPTAYQIRGVIIALRSEIAENILVEG